MGERRTANGEVRAVKGGEARRTERGLEADGGDEVRAVDPVRVETNRRDRGRYEKQG